MPNLPQLTIILGPQTRAAFALNALIRENRQHLAGKGISAIPSRLASPILRRAVDDRPEAERFAELDESTKPRPAILAAINTFGPPQAGMMRNELFPDAEVKLAGLGKVTKGARIILAIDPLPAFFLAAESTVLEERVRQTPWEVLFEVSWFDLVREIVEVLPDADFLVLSSQGVGRDPPALIEHIFGDTAKDLPNPHVLLHQLISETGHAVLDRILARGTPDGATLSDLYKSFAILPTPHDVKERLGIDRVTGILLQQRFEEDLEQIRALPRVEVMRSCAPHSDQNCATSAVRATPSAQRSTQQPTSPLRRPRTRISKAGTS